MTLEESLGPSLTPKARRAWDILLTTLVMGKRDFRKEMLCLNLKNVIQLQEKRLNVLKAKEGSL